jgi:selenocysteine-specific elongation factor
LASRAKVLRSRLQAILADLLRQQKIIALTPGLYIHQDTADKAARRLLEIVGQFHRKSPESPGLTMEQLRQESQLDKAVADGLVALLRQQGRLVEQNQRLALPEHRPSFQDADAKHLEAIEALFRQQAFHPPGVEELTQKTGLPASEVQRLLRVLREHERLVWVGEGFLFHREAVDRARDLLVEHITTKGRLESVDFKYLVDTTRKFALPLLDYFDRIGFLRRVGNTRYLKAPPSS